VNIHCTANNFDLGIPKKNFAQPTIKSKIKSTKYLGAEQNYNILSGIMIYAAFQLSA
jgi:hypothetical protein